MIQLTQRLLITLAFLALFYQSAASAHDARPLYIELDAKSGDQLLIKWKTPPIVEASNEPNVVLSGDDCRVIDNKTVDPLQGVVLYQCNQINDQLRLDIIYPRFNPALTSLIYYTPLTGDRIEHFNDPSVSQIMVGSPPSAREIAQQYIISGAEHIWAGLDHLLFIACLAFIASGSRRLVWAITGFTAGHTLTLIASSYHWVTLPIGFMELLIAISIVVLAVEIKKDQRQSFSWRYPFVTALLFGLLHGFGFASVLSLYGLPVANKLNALISFNIGVEIGQLVFVAVLAGAIYLSRPIIKRYPQCYSMSVSAIGIISGYWVVERFYVLLYV